MKLILLACAVLAVSSLANGVSTEGDKLSFDFNFALTDRQLAITNPSIQRELDCLLNGVEKSIGDDNEMKAWFVEFKKLTIQSGEEIEKCTKLPVDEQQTCIQTVQTESQDKIASVSLRMLRQEKYRKVEKILLEVGMKCGEETINGGDNGAAHFHVNSFGIAIISAMNLTWIILRF